MSITRLAGIEEVGVIVDAFTQVGNGGMLVVNYIGRAPTIGPKIMIHDPSDSSLVGYYKITQVIPTDSLGGLLVATRYTTLGKAFNTAIPAHALLSYGDYQVFREFGAAVVNSDQTILPVSGWVPVASRSVDLGDLGDIGVQSSAVFNIVATVVTDGAWRLRLDGGGFSNDIKMGPFNLAVGDNLISGSYPAYFDPSGGGSGQMALEISTTAGSITYKPGTHLTMTSWYDL